MTRSHRFDPASNRIDWQILVLLISAALLAYSSFGLPPAWYVPINLLVAAGLLLAARGVGLDGTDLGLKRERAAAGLRLGVFAAMIVAAVLALGAAVPALRPLFDDARAAGVGPGLLTYRALLRIPLGTAVLEEVAFRGVLFGAWRRFSTAGGAAVGSSIVFGLWHVRPALELLTENDLAADGPGRGLAVAGAVAGTALAGLVLCWLRLRSDSLVAPYVGHVAVNSLATVAAFVV